MPRPVSRSLKRSTGLAAFAAPMALVLVLAACGDDDDTSLGSEVEIKPSSYVTTPSTTTPPSTAAAPTGEPGEISAQEQSYEIQSGDGLYSIASKFGIEAEEIADYNQWAEGIERLLIPGETIRIPPNAEIPSPEDDEETETTDEDSGDSGDEANTDTTEEADEDPELCPDGERQGHYTIQETDTTRVGVAERLNVTVQQLDDANANTPGYGGFFPGLEILVPCGGDEVSETTEG